MAAGMPGIAIVFTPFPLPLELLVLSTFDGGKEPWSIQTPELAAFHAPGAQNAVLMTASLHLKSRVINQLYYPHRQGVVGLLPALINDIVLR